MGSSIRRNAINMHGVLQNAKNGSRTPLPPPKTPEQKIEELNTQYSALNNQYNALKSDYDGFKQKYEGVAGKIDSQLVDYRQSERPAWETEQVGKDKLRAYGGFKLKANTGAMSGLSGLASGQGTGSNGLGGATRSGGLLNFI